MPEDHAQAALGALDEALARKPHADGHLFSAAVRHMSACRDELIAAGQADQRPALDKVNAVISMLLAGHFPLGSVPWSAIKAARGWLVEIVEGSKAR